MAESDRLKMIAGLGNPGKEYEDTRHNAGFKVIDLLAETFGVEVKKRRFGARFGQCEHKQIKLLLVKPWLYMNRSGEVVRDTAGFYKMDLGDLLVVLDDMWLAPGQIRMRAKGSAGGHNGLADIIEKLGTDQFARLRIGIGASDRPDAVDYVLGRPDSEQERLVEDAVRRAKEAVLCWIENGIDTAMTRFNCPDGKDEQGNLN